VVDELSVELAAEVSVRLSVDSIVEEVKLLAVFAFSATKLSVVNGSGSLDGVAFALVYTPSAIENTRLNTRIQLIIVDVFICFSMNMISF